ncbi:transglutaminase family protein [Ottowia thiooxydans]|uniref:transglutaminase family protein n=1 Tax=Ottowia thiooxydans TaxID=219182 RepID=UPI000490B8E1|nr:transglutaminase family protein [Ottowia thiooxydans]
MLLRIIHDTTYQYGRPVVTAQHLAHLSPVDQPGQRVLLHQLDVDPTPAQRQDRVDAFGNPCCYFALPSPHEQLTVLATSEVVTQAPGPLPPGLPWEQVADGFRYYAGAPYDPAAEFVFASPRVPHHSLLADFAHPAFGPGRPLLEAATDLMQRIYKEMTYSSGSTDVNTPTLEALNQRKGVCQDFAHIMIGSLRSLGLPARYVSGYMLTQPPPGKARLIGADASHAWVQVYDPQAGWADFDPTNNLCGMGRPAETHVTLALGRDFGDVSPLRGVIQGGGSPDLEVSVTVGPPEELKALMA